jgi:tyrosine-protein phosphatase non-receptor type 9
MRQLELAVADSGEQRWINHYHYDAWPDYGVPASTEHLRQLCHALDDCRRIGCHITVHCSAGIGRTGTFLAIDMLLQRLLWLKLQVQQSLSVATITSVLNVPALVAALRQQRAGMVQTMDQYSCVYSVVMEQLLSYESELSEILQAAPAGALPAAEVTGASSSSSGAAQGTAGAGSSSGGMPAAANRTPQTAAGVGTDAAAPRGAAASAAAAVGCIPRALPAADRHGAAGVKLQATPCATAL